ncbi:FHA domain-containing protein [Leptolyngbya boryana NIES-2135]|jgi:hypothetical protein|uniref:FHA domain-containing protein n=1 Tax=Leptolyngbya boryana NIES-2135 TaxID=1973484 RepID=A0A1Z4JBJ2_LEPBY|nr:MULTISPECIES: FHA domain-containing protein [Leptolyngbya]BAY54155.1 FHA domain-containing protein [Leptolyngbya boryana NIES-2135]MBD2371012.1 FHA domain-containing protein [Leptolyngbya sp. FACHB-161]MBD2377530.1 FHA domain-containing protein [Leptolyngbya sp. FACHB-238]MBD2401938.1 FHA domain-containing protein [Leptolyngbya sp. FACHB-239]MBD2408456.1 FHA domain-containing protein [Leptolyngbya sp. FACHB-402]
MINCPVCDASVSEQDDVCSECGTTLTPAKPLDPPQADSPVLETPITDPPDAEVEATDATPAEEPTPTVPSSTDIDPAPQPAPVTNGSARIVFRSNGVATSEAFPIHGNQVVIGRFDPESGPVDIDLGRLPASAIDHISRNHAEITKDPMGRWLLKDLATKNGTFLRSVGQAKWERVASEQASPIQNGDEIAFGNVQFEFHVD